MFFFSNGRFTKWMASLLSKTHVENKVEEETNCVHLYHLSSPSGMYTFLKVNIMKAAEPSRGLGRSSSEQCALHLVCTRFVTVLKYAKQSISLTKLIVTGKGCEISACQHQTSHRVGHFSLVPLLSCTLFLRQGLCNPGFPGTM